MELKHYQERALDRLSRWFGYLSSSGGSPAAAWEAMRSEEELSPNYRSRSLAGSNRAIPHVCLRVPTGGGKTLLGVEAVARYGMRTGLVLWMVPNKAIYEQTKRALRNREHPYRMVLERGSGGRLKILEKSDNFSRADIESCLCILLISLQAANRRNSKEFLKMFQESGSYSTFFPDEDDVIGQESFHEDYPFLELKEGRVVRTQANVLKICEPVIILDEAHKSYGRGNAHDKLWNTWVDQFNPRLVLELSATPDPEKSNILINVSGLDLKAEEMIKLPIHVTAYGTAGSWQDVMRSAEHQLKDLSDKASLLPDDQYIRPMAVVRVPRTGKSQKGGVHLHAEEVRSFLLQTIGLADDEVKVQSGELKELAGEDLMSADCRVRWIITKDALKEGWDCSYAYILVLLDNTSANITVTQMIGRVLRQPYARLTDIAELNQCYVHCSDVDVDKAVSHVRQELEREGFRDLKNQVFSPEKAVTGQAVISSRRSLFSKEEARLPQVLCEDGSALDYEQHILAAVKWDEIGAPSEWRNLTPSAGSSTEVLDLVEEDVSKVVSHDSEPTAPIVQGQLDLAWYARQLKDKVPNPWQAARIVLEAAEIICQEGYDYKWINSRSAAVVRRLARHIDDRVDQFAEKVLVEKLKSGEIKFDMDMPFEFKDSYEVRVPIGEMEVNSQRSLFSPFYSHDLNLLERSYAVFLDKRETIRWWHRVIARASGEYNLQGWRRDRVYPDFVALCTDDVILVHEMKGGHLAGNSDTDYKKRLLGCLQQHFDTLGTVSIRGGNMTGDFRIIFEKDMQEMLV